MCACFEVRHNLRTLRCQLLASERAFSTILALYKAHIVFALGNLCRLNAFRFEPNLHFALSLGSFVHSQLSV